MMIIPDSCGRKAGMTRFMRRSVCVGDDLIEAPCHPKLDLGSIFCSARSSKLGKYVDKDLLNNNFRLASLVWIPGRGPE